MTIQAASRGVPLRKNTDGLTKRQTVYKTRLKNAPSVGIEPTTIGLKGQRSTI